MRASLIIAAHNESDRLWRTVAACVETSAGLDCEIVIAGDASWDGSVEETLRRFPQICVVRHDERKGASPTKDLGARHARGEVLVFLDGHTKPQSGAIGRLVDDVERLNGTAIITPAILKLDVGRWRLTNIRPVTVIPSSWNGSTAAGCHSVSCGRIRIAVACFTNHPH